MTNANTPVPMFRLSIHSAWKEDQDLQHANVENNIDVGNSPGGKSIFNFAASLLRETINKKVLKRDFPFINI